MGRRQLMVAAIGMVMAGAACREEPAPTPIQQTRPAPAVSPQPAGPLPTGPESGVAPRRAIPGRPSPSGPSQPSIALIA
jgi:hypothetical protein